MKLITFKTLTIKNFLSFGEKTQTINLESGVNLITGINHDKEDSKNGTGKSSICDALYFALYGTTLREIAKDFIPNTLTKGTCEVCLVFELTTIAGSDTYQIIRTIHKNSKCILFKNGEEVTRSTLPKTNQYIQELIHTTPVVFQNSVIMSVNASKPFMALSKVEKRKFIESVLGLEVFTQMVLAAREQYSNTKRDYEVAYEKLENIEKELEFVNSQLEKYETNKKVQIQKLTERAKQLAGEIKDNEKKAKAGETASQKIDKYKPDLQEITSTADFLASQKIEVDVKCKFLREKQQEFSRAITTHKTQTSCPWCKREYDNAEEIEQRSIDHIAQLNKELSAIETELEEHTTTLNKINKKALKVSEDKQLLQRKIDDLNATVVEGKRAQQWIDRLTSDRVSVLAEIQTIKNEDDDQLKAKANEIKLAHTALYTKVNELNSKLNVLDGVRFVLSEEGLKAYLVKKIIKVLNARLAVYLKKLDANCLCSFNEYFDETVIDENRNAKCYFNFSAGERKRIDLACLFAFADVRRLQGDVYFNTVFYDELLDSSLDDKGVWLTLGVLRDRFQDHNESCYIITHRGTDLESKANHRIQVEKRNGISYVI